jgi:hypothetical protein
LRARFVVEAHQFEFDSAQHATASVDFVDFLLDMAVSHLALQRKRSALRIDVRDLDGVSRKVICREQTESGRKQPEDGFASAWCSSAMNRTKPVFAGCVLQCRICQAENFTIHRPPSIHPERVRSLQEAPRRRQKKGAASTALNGNRSAEIFVQSGLLMGVARRRS